MNDFFIVRFCRKDSKPEEDYYYNNIVDAKYHLSLFADDDSGLYDNITLYNNRDEVIERIFFN